MSLFKNVFRKSSLCLFILSGFIFLSSCKKNTSLPGVHSISTANILNITDSSAEIEIHVGPDVGTSITSQGVCWSTHPNPTTADNVISAIATDNIFILHMTGLSRHTVYYVRTYATNSLGTTYSNEISFQTLPILGTVTDIDGNVYTTVVIGTQVWMQENLKTTHYNDGTVIQEAQDLLTWKNRSMDSTGAWCYYNENLANNLSIGKLYNFYAVYTGKLAPAGWHVPSKDEWIILSDYLGGISSAGKKMKAGNLWQYYPGQTNTNSSYFTALPSGQRTESGTFYGGDTYAGFWSKENYRVQGLLRYVSNYDARMEIAYEFKGWGVSVRCIKD